MTDYEGNCTICGKPRSECKGEPVTFAPRTTFDLVDHLKRQIAWSRKTFGPGSRVDGVLDHIRKELIEIEDEPHVLDEWIDVVILGLDGAWRSGHTAEQIAQALHDKQVVNEKRQWPDWRTAEHGKAIEHIKEGKTAS